MTMLDAITTQARGSSPTTASSAAGPPGPSGRPDPNPAAKTTSDTSLANLVWTLFYRARDARRPLLAQWKKNYKVLNNRMYTTGGESWVPRPEVPKIWPIVASLVSWMTDQRPNIEVTAAAAPFSQFADYQAQLAEDMNTVLTGNFMEYRLDREISKILWDTCTYGVGYLKTVWEPWLADGKGDSVFRRADPFYIYPDPFARSADQLNYIIEARVLSLVDVDRAFPGALTKVGTRIGSVEAQSSPHKLDDTIQDGSPRVNLAAMAPSTTPRYGAQTASPRGANSTTESPIVTLLECWVRSHTHEKRKDGTTNTTEHWRCVVVCGNTVLLDEDAEDLNAFHSHPYSRMVLFDTGEWYGPCLVEFMTSPQESINRILGMVEANLSLIGNPMLVESPRSQSRNKRITNRPGQRIDANPQEIAWMTPPPMAPDLAMQLVQFYDSQLESVSGMSAIIRGFSPSGRNSQGVMDSVQDSAFVRVRGTLRELECALSDAGKKQLATIAEFYTEPRMLSAIGPDGSRTTSILKSRHFYDPTETADKSVPLRFNLIIDAGSQLSTSKQARRADAIQLYAMGVIDGPEVLKAIQWSNWATVARRVQEMQAQNGTLGQPPGARQRAQH